jgi:Ca-activated chloride channel homolog
MVICYFMHAIRLKGGVCYPDILIMYGDGLVQRVFRFSIIGTAIIAVFLGTLPLRAFQIHVESALVTVPVIVSDSEGKFIPGLKAEEFKLFQDGAPEKISLFLSSEEPFKIALLLDSSISTKSVLGRIKKAARTFLKQMRPNDLAMIVSFDSDIRVLCPLSSDRKELERAIATAETQGSVTKLRDAIVQIQNRFRPFSGRKAIVLLTDGDDHGSVIKPLQLRDEVLSSGSLIYSMFYDTDYTELMKEFGMPSNMPSSSRKRQETDAAWEEQKKKSALYLQELSELSAGRFYRSKITEFDQVFKQISDELHSQYLLGFYPDASKFDGKLHSLSVQLNLQNVTVRSRPSYKIQ